MRTIITFLIILVLAMSFYIGFLIGKGGVSVSDFNTATQLASTITVLRPSFLTPEMIDNFVKGTKLAGLGKYFIEAEKQSGIGADYLLAIAIHESGWGSGPWAVEPWHNLFSWGITDSGPNSEAYKIRNTMTREEAIIYVAKKIKELYLTKGAPFYKGETLGAIGTYYAGDKGWAYGVISVHTQFSKTLPEQILAKQWIMGSRVLTGDAPIPQYYTENYWSRPITREELSIILYRINGR